MAHVEKTVFISYRRTNVAWGLAVYQDLTRHGFDVFFDYVGIASGDFEQVILENIRSRAHVLVLLTPSALERCHEPGDWFRREIEEAIDCRRNIVPLMFDSFNFGAPGIGSQLSGKLALLTRYNGLGVPADYFDAAMAKLRDKFLSVPLDAVHHPLTNTAERAARVRQFAAAAAPLVKSAELAAQNWVEKGIAAASVDEKMRDFDEAIQLNPDHAEAYHQRAIARHGQGDAAGSLKDYDTAVRLDPRDGLIRQNRGLARATVGDHAGALLDFDEAIQRGQRNTRVYRYRGASRHSLGDLKGALSDLEVSVALDPADTRALEDRGLVRRKLGDHRGAVKDYDAALRLKPDDAWLYYGRAKARSELHDFVGAMKDYDVTIRLLPQEPIGYIGRGVARHHQGDYAAAVKDYDQALRLKPDYELAHENRGLARKAAGDAAGAEADFAKARRLRGEVG